MFDKIIQNNKNQQHSKSQEDHILEQVLGAGAGAEDGLVLSISHALSICLRDIGPYNQMIEDPPSHFTGWSLSLSCCLPDLQSTLSNVEFIERLVVIRGIVCLSLGIYCWLRYSDASQSLIAWLLDPKTAFGVILVENSLLATRALWLKAPSPYVSRAVFFVVLETKIAENAAMIFKLHVFRTVQMHMRTITSAPLWGLNLDI